MIQIELIVLDVLKPHIPNILEFSQALARCGADYRVHITVVEIDKNTETLRTEIRANGIDYDLIQSTIMELGASIHSIDEVEVHNEKD